MLANHQPFVIWFTGLSGSGKSTLADSLNQYFITHNRLSYRLDGDNIRQGLCRDLSFSAVDRKENIRRIGEVSSLFVDAGLIVVASFISPFNVDRQFCRSLVPDHTFIEVYLKCPLTVCEKRDVKGLYKKARAGEIAEFTGIDSAYEVPRSPEIILDTDSYSIEQCVHHIVLYLNENSYL